MLYVTTRNDRDAVTAQKAVLENRGSDGGFYVPFHMPMVSKQEIARLKEKSFGQIVAEMLNIMFNTKLTSWDVDFCIGRYPIRIKPLGYRTVIAETWHNPEWCYERLVTNLMSLISPQVQEASDWLRIAIRIAVFFGIYGELARSETETVDVVVVTGDISAPASIWYARQWGLPIGNIVCCCNENNQFWDLVCHGQMRTDALSISTGMPDADIAFPEELERLIFACGGSAEVLRYLDACREGRMYLAPESVLKAMRKGVYVSVASSGRVRNTIPAVYQTHDYVLSSYSALCYAGLMDYRSKTGIMRNAVVLAEKSPMVDAAAVAASLGITEEALREILI